jgi:hypothetical protein
MDASWRAQDDEVMSIDLPLSELTVPGDVKISIQSFGAERTPVVLTAAVAASDPPPAPPAL